MPYTYEHLSWDSEFFGFKVGKLIGEIPDLNDLKDIEQLLLGEGSKLTYFPVEKLLPGFVHESRSLVFSMVDKKSTFLKDINPDVPFHPSITFYHSAMDTARLLELAVLGGVFSRYYVDERIDKDKYAEMYRLMLLNSLQKQMALETIVYMVEGEMAGFLTLCEKNKRGDLGLMAVDTKFRGKGIGKALILAGEHWLGKQGYQEIQIVTQGENIPACRLYESHGYHVDEMKYFYHVWTV